MPSGLYETLRATALECFNSMDNIYQGEEPQQHSASTKYEISSPRIRAVRTPDYIQEYGHGYMIKVAKPGHYVSLTIDSLIAHLRAAGPSFRNLRTEVKRVVVDEVRLEVAVWMTIWITVGGLGGEIAAAADGEEDGKEQKEAVRKALLALDEEVEYEMAWFYEMVGGEGGMKVRKATEFVDGYAADQIAELVALRARHMTS